MLSGTAQFTSPLAGDCSAFLDFKRALGYRYERAEFMLRSFDRFLVAHRDGPAVGQALPELILSWLGRRDGRKPVSIASELAVVREFCRFRRRRDPEAFVPGRTWLHQLPESSFLPYLFSEAEVHKILAGIGILAVEEPLEHVLRALILILYCTGLRPGEAVRLHDTDVDLKAAIFSINESKGRSRLVPFGADLAEELRRYLDRRDRACEAATPGAFLIAPGGTAITMARAAALARSLFRRLGLKPPHGRSGPRLYDFRHAFAVQRLTLWYREGQDIHAKLPWLSAYMGHLDLLGTESYLRATPELMSLAADRFEARFKRDEAAKWTT